MNGLVTSERLGGVFTVSLSGLVYGAPPTRPGTVVPTEETAEFTCTGTIHQIGEAWERWSNQPVYSDRGRRYPRRWLFNGVPLRPADQIIRTLIGRHGGSHGDWCAVVNRALRGLLK